MLWCFLPYIDVNHPCVYMCLRILIPSHLPPHPIPLGCPRSPALSALLHPPNLQWSSILHKVIYMFQCCSLKSSHSCLLPQNPKVCCLYLCFFCCLAYLSKFHICVLIYYIGVFLYDFTLYNRLQFHPPH